MYFFKRRINAENKIDSSKKIFSHLPQHLKLLLTLSEIRLVLALHKQYLDLRQKKVQNIASVISPDEYISDELVKIGRNIPYEVVSVIVDTRVQERS